MSAPTAGAATGIVAALLPEPVVCVETDDLDGPDDLFPEEAAVVARAVERRRREFAAVRRCARAALARLGLPPAPILPGVRGAPRWPSGVVGSMSHCCGHAVAAVAPRRAVASVGIDVEERGPLPGGVLRVVARPEEVASVGELAAAAPGVPWDRIVFSAKESVYKAWFPLTGRGLGFQDARVSLAGTGELSAELLAPPPVVGGVPVPCLRGRWAIAGGVVATAVVVPAGGGSVVTEGRRGA